MTTPSPHHHMTPPPPPGPGSTKGLWVTIIALASLLIAAVVDVLTQRAGAAWEAGLIAGGGAFLGACTLGLLVLGFLWPPNRP
ncbi:hypothetical protein ACWIGI_36435 [Nocardia sp. NPDC055321]